MHSSHVSGARSVWAPGGPPGRDNGGHDAKGVRQTLFGDGRSAVRSGFPRMDGTVPASEFPGADSGAVSGRREYPPGAGRADGGPVGAAGGSEHTGGPRFDQPVPTGGYAWWSLDALSDDGRNGLTIIAFIGSVFSPYYANARVRDPLHYCALNVALYHDKGSRWAMTERGRIGVRRDATTFSIGPSSVHWNGTILTVDIDEVTVPFPSRIKGQVRLYPSAIVEGAIALDPEGRHRWRPLAPCARVEVDLKRPDLTWSGPGYLDTNAGDGPLERDFVRWDWSRATLSRSTAVLYDVTCRDGEDRAVAIEIDGSGKVRDFAPPPTVSLPRTRWRVDRGTRADEGFGARVRRTLEDSPFYARSILETHLLGEHVPAIHESLMLDRFRQKWVQFLLPFRMPRRRR